MTDKPMDELLAVMAKLRDPQNGCPWDLEQTFRTIVPHTIEEAYEVAEAIERDDVAAIKDELGDLLFQVVFYAQMGREAGWFDFQDIAAGMVEKMIRRHPHVFGDATITSAAAQTEAWEAQKAHERAAKMPDANRVPSVLDGITTTLPALSRAVKLQKRAARIGFDWPDAMQVLDKIAEEIDEVREEIAQGAELDRTEDEMGDLLFACVNLARKLEIDPEQALRRGNRKFERRFHSIEAGLAAAGRKPGEADLEEMEALWQRAKEIERGTQE